MSRRISVLVAVTALAVSSFAYAADSARERKQEKTQQETTAQAATKPDAATQAAVPAPAPTLEEAFAVSAEAESIETEDGVSAVGPIEVVVARIGPDGKPVIACVDNVEAARRFFKAPAEQQAPKQAKEQ